MKSKTKLLADIKYTFNELKEEVNSTYGLKQLGDNNIISLTKGIFIDKGRSYITEDICVLESIDYVSNRYYYRNVGIDEVITIAISPYEIYGAEINDSKKPYIIGDFFKIGDYLLAGSWDKTKAIGSSPIAPPPYPKKDPTDPLEPTIERNALKIVDIDLDSWTVTAEFRFKTPDADHNHGQELLEYLVNNPTKEVPKDEVPTMPSYPVNLTEGIFSLKALLRSENTYYYNFDVNNPSNFKESLKGLVVFIGNAYASKGFINENHTVMPIDRSHWFNDSYADTSVGFITEVLNPPASETGKPAPDYLAKVSFFTNDNKTFIENFDFKGIKYADPKYDNFPDVNTLARANEIIAGITEHNVGGGLLKVTLGEPNGTDLRVRSLGFYNTFTSVTGSGETRGNPVYLRQYANITNLRHMEYVLSKREYPTGE